MLLVLHASTYQEYNIYVKSDRKKKKNNAAAVRIRTRNIRPAVIWGLINYHVSRRLGARTTTELSNLTTTNTSHHEQQASRASVARLVAVVFVVFVVVVVKVAGTTQRSTKNKNLDTSLHFLHLTGGGGSQHTKSYIKSYATLIHL